MVAIFPKMLPYLLFVIPNQLERTRAAANVTPKKATSGTIKSGSSITLSLKISQRLGVLGTKCKLKPA